MGTFDRDSPLTLNWQCDLSLIEDLGLCSKRPRQTEAMSGVLGALLNSAETNRWISYPRNRNRFSGQQRYYGPAFTYRCIIGAIDEIDRAGLIEHEKAKPGSSGWQSRMRASRALIEAASDSSELHYLVHEPLRLKNGDRLIPYVETAQTYRWRRELQEINTTLGGIKIDLPGVPRTARHLWINDNPILITPRPSIHRVFVRGSWECGGRCFAWWQSCPGKSRDNFRLNGESVARPDYCALHGQLLYAKRSAAMHGDVYDVGCGFTRDQGKLAFQIGVNARGRRRAIAAIAEHVSLDWPRAAALLDAVKARNAPIEDAFGSDIGVKLMRLDSEIILGCLKTCALEGIPALPVHDELVVPARYASRAAEIMVENFESRLPPVTPCQVRLK